MQNVTKFWPVSTPLSVLFTKCSKPSMPYTNARTCFCTFVYFPEVQLTVSLGFRCHIILQYSSVLRRGGQTRNLCDWRQLFALLRRGRTVLGRIRSFLLVRRYQVNNLVNNQELYGGLRRRLGDLLLWPSGRFGPWSFHTLSRQRNVARMLLQAEAVLARV